jgi:hypothetical protein
VTAGAATALEGYWHGLRNDTDEFVAPVYDFVGGESIEFSLRATAFARLQQISFIWLKLRATDF